MKTIMNLSGAFRRPYWNVIILTAALVIGFLNIIMYNFADLPAAMGFDDLAVHLSRGILVNMAILVFTNLMATSGYFAKRAHTDRGSSLSVNALVLAGAAFWILLATLPTAQMFYLGPTPASLEAHAAVDSAIQNSMTLAAIMNAVLGAGLSLISTFATGDGEISEEPK